MAKVRVVTSRFESAHGRKPVGFGLWVFEVAGHDFSFYDSWTMAKIRAIRLATSVGARSVHVQG